MTPTSFKAAHLTAFGPPEALTLVDRPLPQIRPDQILVRTLASTVNSGDVRIRSKSVPQGYGVLMSLVFGFRTPRTKVLGTVFAGEIVALGSRVTGFDMGELVFGSTELKMGCHAEYVVLNASAAVVPLPDTLDPMQGASLVFGGTTADYYINKLGLKKDEKILINAAAGSVGLAMTQMAHALGANVTAIASARNHAFLRAHGADQVVDYTTTDVTALPGGFDVIADCLGTMPFRSHRHQLTPRGRFAMITGTLAQALAAPISNLVSRRKIIGGTSLASKAALSRLVELVNTQALTPSIDRTFAFKDITDAHRYVDTGHKRGNVVIRFTENDDQPTT